MAKKKYDYGGKNRYRLSVDTEKLEKLDETLTERAKQVISKTAFDIEAGTKGNIRKHDLIDTGNMLNSVQVLDVIADKGFSKEVVIGAEYAVFHELGTVHLPAKHMMGESVENVRPGFDAAMKQIFKDL